MNIHVVKLLLNLSTDKLRKNIKSLLTELKELTGVSNEELEEFEKILELGSSDEKISN